MLKIRLRRMGSRHRPFYRVVVSDSRRTPTASAIEEIGYYDPRKEPPVVAIDAERVEHWLSRGAQLSDAVKKLTQRSGAPQPGVPAEAEEAARVETAETEAAEAEAADTGAAEPEAATAEITEAEAAAQPDAATEAASA